MGNSNCNFIFDSEKREIIFTGDKDRHWSLLEYFSFLRQEWEDEVLQQKIMHRWLYRNDIFGADKLLRSYSHPVKWWEIWRG